MDVAGLDFAGFTNIEGLEVAGFQIIEEAAGLEIIEEAAGLEVQAHTEDAMDADTPQTSEHWWLQSRPGRNDSMSLRASNSATNGRQELLSVSPLEDLMRTIHREHSSAADRDVQFFRCSTRNCSRAANHAGYETCCGKCSSQGPHCHTRECHGRQSLAMSTLVKRQQVLERLMAKVDALPHRGTTRTSEVPYDDMR